MSPDTTTRRGVLKLTGTALAGAVGTGTAVANHFHPDVSTDPATNVGTDTATLNGTLSDMGNADSVDVWFKWDLKVDDLQNSTSRQTLTSTGSFSEEVVVASGTTYEFQAFADNGNAVESGVVREFTTPTECSECQPKE